MPPVDLRSILAKPGHFPVAFEALRSEQRYGPGERRPFRRNLSYRRGSWDGITEPIAGYLSDHHKSKRGRAHSLHHGHDNTDCTRKLPSVGAAVAQSDALA